MLLGWTTSEGIMVARSCNSNVDSVGVNPDCILRGSRIPADVSNTSQKPDKEGHLAAFRTTSHWQDSNYQALQDVSLDVHEEEEIKQELKMSEEYYIPACKTLYTTSEEVQDMI